jgi:AcrR family transcriptional regulator
MVARILDAAAASFELHGYRATTTNLVAESARVSVGSLYQYFPNKDALLVGLAERHLDEVMPRLVALADHLETSEPTGEELCRVMVDEVEDLNRSDRLHRLLWEAPRTSEVLERFGELEEAMARAVEAHLGRLGHPAAVAGVRARLLVTVVGAAVHAIRPDVERDLQVDEIVRCCVGIVRCPA